MAGSSQSTPFRFLDLPAEIRNTVYELVHEEADRRFASATLPTSSTFTVSGGDYFSHCTVKPSRRLSETCRQVRKELLPIIYGRFNFTFLLHSEEHHLDNVWGPNPTQNMFDCILRMTLADYQHYRRTKRDISQRRHHSGHPDLCFSQFNIDVRRVKPHVDHVRDPRCEYCPEHEDGAVARIDAVLGTLDQVGARRRLTKAKLKEIFEAAAWPAEVNESEVEEDDYD